MKLLTTTLPLTALLLIAPFSFMSCEQSSSNTTEKSEPSSQSEDEAQTKVSDASDEKSKNIIKPTPVDVSKISFDSIKKPAVDETDPSSGLVRANENSKDRADTQNQELQKQVVTLTPAALDLGTFSTSEKGEGSVTLTNTGDEPVTIERAKASCGCTTSDFKPNTVLQPGESTDVSVTMDGKGQARKMSKNVTFTITDHPSLRLNVTAETVAYVNLDKSPLTIEDDFGIDTITLTSVDDQPFTVTSILPAIAVELPTEPATTQELKLDWKTFWDVVQTTKITIRVDHPLCKEITTNVRLSAQQRQKLNEIIKLRREGGELPTKDPTRPLTGDQLARYIEAGRGEQVLKYINDGLGQYNAVNKRGVSLLSIAAESGDAVTVQGLLEMGAEIERIDGINRTPIMYAARSKNPETIQILIEAGADIQARGQLGNTPLSWAAGFGNADGVQVFIDAGADPNTVDNVLGYTPLIWASGFGDSNAVPILIEAGADVTVYDIAEGRTPLMHAVRTGKVEAMKALIEAGAKVDNIDRTKSTALIIGAGNNNVTLEKITLLVESGADISKKNSEGKTALDVAKARTDDEGKAIAEYLSSKTDSE